MNVPVSCIDRVATVLSAKVGMSNGGASVK